MNPELCATVQMWGLPQLHLSLQTPITAWKENIFIRAPSIINKDGVKSEYVSEELNNVEAGSGF